MNNYWIGGVSYMDKYDHYDLICYIALKYKSYLFGEISLVVFIRYVLDHMQLHYRDYESISIIKFMKKMLKKSTWKEAYDSDCWIYKPDYPMPWLGCMIDNYYGFFTKDGRNIYMEVKAYIESKVYTPFEALEMIESRWDYLCKKEIGYHALKYCVLNTNNHQAMFIGLYVLRIILNYIVVDIKRLFTIKTNGTHIFVKKEGGF